MQRAPRIVRAALEGVGASSLRARAKARFPWLLFLAAQNTVLSPDWEGEANRFMERVDTAGPSRSQQRPSALRLDDRGARPRTLERLVWLRCAALRLPYGDQGLLIPRRLYERPAATGLCR